MKFNFNNKRALILAGSKGIGLGIAKSLYKLNCRVIIASSSKKNLSKAKKELGTNCKTINFNIKSEYSVDQFIKKIKKIDIDILVLNAPGPKSISLKECKFNDLKSSINYLLINIIKISQSVLPNMEKKRFGRIINISSLTAVEPEQNMSFSNIPRAGLLSYIKTASKEYTKKNITFNSILTGGVLTERSNEMITLEAKRNKMSFQEYLREVTKKIPSGYIPNPDEFSNIIIFLCSELSGSINGSAIPIDGGFKNSM